MESWVTEESTAGPGLSEDRIEKVRQIFSDDPCLSIPRAFTAVNMPASRVHRILRNCQYLFLFMLQNLYFVRQFDRENRLKFSHYCQ